MKTQKGVTLISLTIYVIAMAIVIGILATVTTFFYKNIQDVNVDIDPLIEFTTFNSYFSEEVDNSSIEVTTVSTTDSEQNYIVFLNNAEDNKYIQYTFVKANKGIYRDKVKICRNIENCTFEENIINGKSVVTVYIKAGDKERTVDYTLKN